MPLFVKFFKKVFTTTLYLVFSLTFDYSSCQNSAERKRQEEDAPPPTCGIWLNVLDLSMFCDSFCFTAYLFYIAESNGTPDTTIPVNQKTMIRKLGKSFALVDNPSFDTGTS
jgi:hypothetical protein